MNEIEVIKFSVDSGDIEFGDFDGFFIFFFEDGHKSNIYLNTIFSKDKDF